MTLKALLCMTACKPSEVHLKPGYDRRHQNWMIHVTILSAAVGERQWRTMNHKNLAVKVKLSFLMAPFGSITQSAPSLSTDKYRSIHLLMVSLSDVSLRN